MYVFILKKNCSLIVENIPRPCPVGVLDRPKEPFYYQLSMPNNFHNKTMNCYMYDCGCEYIIMMALYFIGPSVYENDNHYWRS